MIRIDPDTIYSREDLTAMFAPQGVKWDSLRAKLEHSPGLRKFTIAGWLGSDILSAMRQTETIQQAKKQSWRNVTPPHTGKRGRPSLGLTGLLPRER